jgi:hypothetical protein
MSGQSGGINNNAGTLDTRGGDAVGRDKTTNITHIHYGKPRQLFRSTIPELRNRFIGREDDPLHEIGAALGDPSQRGVVVLRGQAGVGKSELAREFARQHLKEYPGGTFFAYRPVSGT